MLLCYLYWTWRERGRRVHLCVCANRLKPTSCQVLAYINARAAALVASVCGEWYFAIWRKAGASLLCMSPSVVD